MSVLSTQKDRQEERIKAGRREEKGRKEGRCLWELVSAGQGGDYKETYVSDLLPFVYFTLL